MTSAPPASSFYAALSLVLFQWRNVAEDSVEKKWFKKFSLQACIFETFCDHWMERTRYVGTESYNDKEV
jgi:hypothetical protein